MMTIVFLLGLFSSQLWGQNSGDPNMGHLKVKDTKTQSRKSESLVQAATAADPGGANQGQGVPIGRPPTGTPESSEARPDAEGDSEAKNLLAPAESGSGDVDKAGAEQALEETREEVQGESGDPVLADVDALSEEEEDEEVDVHVVTAKPEVLEELPSWNCRVDTPPKSEGSFTVGEKFVLICSGETVDFNRGKIHFQMPEPLLYAIKILTVDRVKPNELLFTATSYLAGQHDLKGLVIVEDMQEKLTVTPLVLNVRSLIKDPKQKPYGPQRALALTYPPWLWISLLAFGLFIVFFVLFRLHRRAQKLRVLEGLKLHNSALGAYNQLNKDLRQLNRSYVFSKHREWTSEKTKTYMGELDSFFRLYLLREFIVPATEWKSSLVIKEIQKSDRKSFSAYGSMLTKYLKELDRAKGSIDKLGMEDCQQLTQLARRVSQKIWQEHQKTKTLGGGQS